MKLWHEFPKFLEVGRCHHQGVELAKAARNSMTMIIVISLFGHSVRKVVPKTVEAESVATSLKSAVRRKVIVSVSSELRGLFDIHEGSSHHFPAYRTVEVLFIRSLNLAE